MPLLKTAVNLLSVTGVINRVLLSRDAQRVGSLKTRRLLRGNKFTAGEEKGRRRDDVEVEEEEVGSHQNCRHDFDGNGGEIAHSQQAGNMHFDDEENFKSIRTYTSEGIFLLRVAVHEIGHVLGLAHTNKSQSIMYAIYRGAELQPDFELTPEDRKDIQKIYGVCKGQFSSVFDWVRKRPDNTFIYNTYFFRENHYWMYENHANRTRYGDPLYIAREWKGVPDSPDGYLHTWYYTGTDIVDEAFFFKGKKRTRCFVKVSAISSTTVTMIWYTKVGPEELRTVLDLNQAKLKEFQTTWTLVFFDMRDKNIYFFKGDMVYVYDPKEPEETRGCCVRKRKITEEFPPAGGHDPLPANLDAVYYSYQDKMQYFIKGENLWRNKIFDPRDRRTVNSVELVGKWYDRWMDICDVQAH
ncbi:hypothetical protein C0Q70_09683 [Pomacea canaliculata]|uniref:Peptidase metallopeptidase domain-containing protein n=1 Tax=Pomacea canaliculata TaxID=400727 RepID=A0A2T7PAH3_POMCA|nr:hypothetical protein C0Q70_09683 [Pomacea canaliculata]